MDVSIQVNNNSSINDAIGANVTFDQDDVSIGNVASGEQLALNFQVGPGLLPLSATIPLPFSATPNDAVSLASAAGAFSVFYNSSAGLPSSFPFWLSTNGPSSQVLNYLNLNPKPDAIVGATKLPSTYQPVVLLVGDQNQLTVKTGAPGFSLGKDLQSLIMVFESGFSGFAVTFQGWENLQLKSLTFPRSFALTADAPPKLVLDAVDNTVTVFCTVVDPYIREFSYTIDSSAGRHDPTIVNNPDSGTHG